MACTTCTTDIKFAATHTDHKQSATVLRLVNARLGDIAAKFADILDKRKQRRALLRLSDHMLCDIGLTRADAEEEYRNNFKWF